MVEITDRLHRELEYILEHARAAFRLMQEENIRLEYYGRLDNITKNLLRRLATARIKVK